MIFDIDQNEAELLVQIIRKEIDRLENLDDDQMWAGTIEDAKTLGSILCRL